MKPTYSTKPFSFQRKQIVDFLSVAKKRHTASVIMEMEITGVRDALRVAKRQQGKVGSLTGYLIYCYAQAIAEEKAIQGYRWGSKLVVFDDVDISTMVERKREHEYIPVAYVIRKAHEKSIFEISQELIEAKNGESSELMEGNSLKGFKKVFVNFLKQFKLLRRIALKRIFQNPFLKKEFNGTVGFSSMGMFTINVPGWIIPITPQVLTLMVAGIRKLPALEKGQLVEKEYIDLTLAIDHDTLDGAQTGRFIERLRKNILKARELLTEMDEVEN